MKYSYLAFALLLSSLHAEDDQVLAPLKFSPTKESKKTEITIESERVGFHEPIGDEKLSLQEKVQYFFGTMVSSSPYPGTRATFEGTELMANLSSVNRDLQLLIEQKQFEEFIKRKKLKYPTHPRMFLSGQIEATAFVQKDAQNKPRSDIDLTNVELDILIATNPWLNGFFSFVYDNTVGSNSTNRISNSRVQVDVGMIMFGSLDRFPGYLTIGQTYLPFGQFSTYNAVHDPMTKILFRLKQREVATAYYEPNLNGSLFVFKGPSDAGSGNNINNYGLNLGCNFEIETFAASFAFSAIRNIADSEGMQVAFGATSNTNVLRHIVPAIDARANLSYGPVNLIFEYDTCLRAFNPRDMAFGYSPNPTKGARPAATDLELAYTFPIFKHPSSVALAWSRSYQALGFNVPWQRAVFTWATYIMKGTLLSFEAMWDKLYPSDSRATGQIVPNNPYFINTNNLGKDDFTFSVDLLFYW